MPGVLRILTGQRAESVVTTTVAARFGTFRDVPDESWEE